MFEHLTSYIYHENAKKILRAVVRNFFQPFVFFGYRLFNYVLKKISKKFHLLNAIMCKFDYGQLTGIKIMKN